MPVLEQVQLMVAVEQVPLEVLEGLVVEKELVDQL